MKTYIRCIFAATALLTILGFSGCAGKLPPLEPPQMEYHDYDKYLSVETEELIRAGIKYHDQGDYENALNYYLQAMETAPNHPIIFYEMGFSYISMGDYGAALEMAEKGIAEAKIRSDEDVIPSLLDLKGSALDNLGRSDEAIDVYMEAINQYGVSNTFLYYNLAVSYYRIDKLE